MDEISKLVSDKIDIKEQYNILLSKFNKLGYINRGIKVYGGSYGSTLNLCRADFPKDNILYVHKSYKKYQIYNWESPPYSEFDFYYEVKVDKPTIFFVEDEDWDTIIESDGMGIYVIDYNVPSDMEYDFGYIKTSWRPSCGKIGDYYLCKKYIVMPNIYNSIDSD